MAKTTLPTSELVIGYYVMDQGKNFYRADDCLNMDDTRALLKRLRQERPSETFFLYAELEA